MLSTQTEQRVRNQIDKYVLYFYINRMMTLLNKRTTDKMRIKYKVMTVTIIHDVNTDTFLD